MRTAFFILGSVAALAGWTNALDLHSELDLPLDIDSALDLDTDLDTDLEEQKRKAYQHHQLSWGDKCSKVTNQECKLNPDCSVCRYSWPKFDPKKWKSSEAACRCKADSKTFATEELNWGNKCNAVTDQDCGKNPNCSICRWSWPKNDR